MKNSKNISHGLLMMIGCAAMLVALLALTLLPSSGGGWGFYLLLLLCPFMHIFMHKRMHGKNNHHELMNDQSPPLKTEESGQDPAKLSQ